MRNWLRDLITEAIGKAIDGRWPLLEVKDRPVYNIQGKVVDAGFPDAQRLEKKRDVIGNVLARG